MKGTDGERRLLRIESGVRVWREAEGTESGRGGRGGDK